MPHHIDTASMWCTTDVPATLCFMLCVHMNGITPAEGAPSLHIKYISAELTGAGKRELFSPHRGEDLARHGPALL